MRNVAAFVVGLLLAVFAGVSMGAESCTEYRVRWSGGGSGGSSPTVYGPWYYTRLEACQELGTRLIGRSFSGSVTTQVVDVAAGASNSSPCLGVAKNAVNNPVASLSGSTLGESRSAACPTDPCDDYSGKKVTYAQNFPGGLPEMGGNFNIPVAAGCGAERTAASSCTPGAGGAFFCMVTYTYTGDAPESSPSTPGGGQAKCAVIKGERNCAVDTDEDTGETCGTFNGERVCFPVDPTTSTGSAGQPLSGACWSTASGGLLCASDAEVEDDAGDPVAPTQTLVTGNSTSSYYSPTTLVSAGATVVVTGAGNMGSETPAPDSDCTGLDCLDGGDLGAVGDVGDVASGAMGRIGSAPIVAAVTGLSGSLTGGACPSWATTIEAGAFGTFEMDFGFICGMWEDIAPIIAAVMLAGWALVALRILMSA